MNDEKTNKIMSSEELDDVLPKYEPIKLSGKNLAQNYVSAFNTGMNIYQCVNYLQGNIDWTINAVNDVVKSWNTEVSESIEQSKAIVKETTTEQFNKEWTAKQPELIEQVNTLTTNQFNEDWGVLENRINTTLETQNTKINSIQTQQNNLASNQTNLANQQTTLSNRMDTFTSLSEGSTTGDAELKDIRVGANGITYNNAGDAVRGQYSQLKEDLSNLIGSNFVFEYNSFNLLGDYATNRKYNTDKQAIISDEVSSLSIAEVKPETEYFYFIKLGDTERMYYADTIFLDKNLSYIDCDKNILRSHSTGLVYFKMYTTPSNCAYVLQRSRTVDRPLTVLFERKNNMLSIANINSIDMETTWKKPTFRIFNDVQLEVFKKTEYIRSCVANERVYPATYPDLKYDNDGNIVENDELTCITPILPICPDTQYKRSAIAGSESFVLEYDINRNLIKTYTISGIDEKYQCAFKTSKDTAYIAFTDNNHYHGSIETKLFYYPTETKTVIVGDGTSEFVDKRLEEYSEDIQNSINGINDNFSYVVNLTSNGIQTAIDECVNRGGGVVQLVPNATYICTNTINVYSDMVDIIGNGAKLDFSENQDDIGIHIRASGKVTDLHEIFRQQATHKITGVYIIGSNRQNNYEGGRIGTAVLLQSDNSARPSMNFALEHCAIAGFQIGLDIQSQAWTNTLYACDISACDIGVNHSYGHSNCGERNTLISCNIHTCSLAVSCSHWAGTIECIATSFDYNFKTFKITDRGHIIATNCHIENTKDKDYFFDINNGDLIVKNSVFYCNQATYGLIKVANYGRVVLKDNIQESWSMADDNVVGDTVKYVVEWI